MLSAPAQQPIKRAPKGVKNMLDVVAGQTSVLNMNLKIRKQLLLKLQNMYTATNFVTIYLVNLLHFFIFY